MTESFNYIFFLWPRLHSPQIKQHEGGIKSRNLYKLHLMEFQMKCFPQGFCWQWRGQRVWASCLWNQGSCREQPTGCLLRYFPECLPTWFSLQGNFKIKKKNKNKKTQNKEKKPCGFDTQIFKQKIHQIPRFHPPPPWYCSIFKPQG